MLPNTRDSRLNLSLSLSPLSFLPIHVIHVKALSLSLSFYETNVKCTIFVTPRNLCRYKLGKIIMTGICIGMSYGK